MKRKRSGVAIVAALGLAVGLLTPPATAATTTAATTATAAPAVPVLNWQPCDGDFFCATATVPLDYADPAGATIQLAVIKHPATDTAHRIGSVFFNPGGPGGSGVAALPLVYSYFPAALRARFDVVSFDPRGVALSTDLNCFDSLAQEQQLFAAMPAGFPTTFPVGVAQQQVWEHTAAAFDQACATHAGPLLAHDSTADSARDMDLLRQAVGDAALNYLGISYGSYLGATYANLFPGKVRAITLDGDIDPVQWATGTDDTARLLDTFLRQGSDQGSAATLNAFLDLCGQAPVTSCAFSAGSPAATHAKYDTLLNRLAANPVTLSGQTFTMADTVAIVGGALYETQPVPNLSVGWSGLASVLQVLWQASTSGTSSVNSAAVARMSATLPKMPDLGVLPAAGTPYNGVESIFGIVCSDSPNPRIPALYPVQADFAAARSGPPGRYWAWLTEVCAQWPVLAPQRYTGPWNRPTAQPILVVGNTIDPATPYQGAIAMSRDLASARLLTVSGYGHTALLNPSSCAQAIEGDYFVTGALPPPGTVCQQDQPPFAG